MSSLEKLKKLKAEFQAMVKDEGKAILKGVLTDFFEANPTVESLRWKQYTPYFNDGDPCLFSIHEPYVRLKDTPEDSELGDYEDGYQGSWELRESNKALSKNLDALYQEMEEMKEVLEALGDHSQVTATHKSIEVDEYEHD